MLGSFAESLTTRSLWWRMSQAGTQEDISRKFHTMVSEEKMLEYRLFLSIVILLQLVI